MAVALEQIVRLPLFGFVIGHDYSRALAWNEDVEMFRVYTGIWNCSLSCVKKY